MLAKKRGRPATGRGQTIGVRCMPDLIDALDTYRLKQQPPINRAAAIRQFVTEALKRRGLLKAAR
jgi:hypothetical protein